MKTIFTILIILFIFLYFQYKSKPNKDRGDIYLMTFIFIFLSSFFTVILTMRAETFYIDGKYFLIPVLIIFLFHRMVSKIKKNSMKLMAKQNSYWGVASERILDKFKYRITKKLGRNEINEINDEYFYNTAKGEKELNAVKYGDISNYRKFTIVKNIDKFIQSEKSSELYKILYKKLKELNLELEANLNFQNVLKENNYCLQFFFIDLWGRLAKNEILGTATLDVLAENEKELDLIGALDSEKNSNVQLQGLELYSHYLNFKNVLESV